MPFPFAFARLNALQTAVRHPHNSNIIGDVASDRDGNGNSNGNGDCNGNGKGKGDFNGNGSNKGNSNSNGI